VGNENGGRHAGLAGLRVVPPPSGSGMNTLPGMLLPDVLSYPNWFGMYDDLEKSRWFAAIAWFLP
jgi:hypothetical protein